MKKIFALLIVLCMLIGGMPVLAADSDWDFDAYYYFLRGYSGTDQHLQIPAYLEGCPVEVLEDNILRDNQDIVSVTLPETMLDLRYCNFYNNENLESVSLPESLIIIGDSNFYMCNRLKEITIPSSVCYIGKDCFSLCEQLESVTFEGACPAFGPDCFDWNEQQINVYVPDDQLDAYRAALPEWLNVQPSGKNAVLHDYTSDEYYYTILDDSVIVAYDGFETRVDIPSVIYDETITAIGDEAFPISFYVSYVTVPEGVVSIGNSAFAGLHQLVHVDLPSTLRTIGDNAFEGFRGYSIELPEGLEYIGSNAFKYSYLEGSLVLPSTITSVSEDFLNDCLGVERLVVEGDPLCLPADIQERYPDLEIVLGEDATEAEQQRLHALLYGAPELVLSAQPEDVFAYAGEEAAVSVEAVGDGLSYAWYVRNMREKNFVLDESADGSRYSVTADASCDGRQVYCVVSDVYGASVESDIAMITVGTPLEITIQPQAVEGLAGETASFSVEASGDGVCYQWYLSSGDGEDFQPVEGAVGSVYSVNISEANNGARVYCTVTDAYGKSLSSDSAAIVMEEAELAPEPALEPAPEPAAEVVPELPAPEPVGAEGEAFLGEWKADTIDMGGMVFGAADFGMVMDLCFNADGSVHMYDGMESETAAWSVSGGVATVMDMRMTITDDGRLCTEEEGMKLFFVRGDAAAEPAGEMSEEEQLMALLALMAQTEEGGWEEAPEEDDAGAVAAHLNRKFIADSFTTYGQTMDASMLGAEYSLLFREDGSVDFCIAGMLLPNLSWTHEQLLLEEEEAEAFVIDYYGTMFNAVLTEDGFDLDYYGTMTLHLVPAEAE